MRPVKQIESDLKAANDLRDALEVELSKVHFANFLCMMGVPQGAAPVLTNKASGQKVLAIYATGKFAYGATVGGKAILAGKVDCVLYPDVFHFVVQPERIST